MQVEQAAEDVKRREAMLVRREGDLSRLEATASTSQADTLKRDVELSNREQALASQLAKVKAAEAQLHSKQLEAKELQVRLSQQHYAPWWTSSCCLNKLQVLYIDWDKLDTYALSQSKSCANYVSVCVK